MKISQIIHQQYIVEYQIILTVLFSNSMHWLIARSINSYGSALEQHAINLFNLHEQ